MEEARKEIRALQSIQAKKAPKSFTENIQKLNYDTEYMAKYLIVMQKGIDDGNKNIVEKIKDLIENLVIVFSGGSGVSGFEDFIPVVQPLLATVPILGDLMEIISGVEDGDLNDVGSWVSNLLNNLGGLGRNTNRILLELQSKLSEGATFSDTFDRNDNSSLGNGWTQGGEGSNLEIMGNAARINGLPFSTGRRYAICPKKADDNDVAVSVGVNNKGIAPAAMTTLFIQSNANLTEFVYANLYKKAFYIGRGTRSGNNWTFNDWKSSTQKELSEGGLVEFTAEGTKYKLTANGETLLEHTDVSGYPRDDLHRNVAFAEETKVVGIIPQFSWGVVAFTMRSQVKLTAVQSAITKADDAKNTATSASNTATAANNTATAANNNATAASNVATEANNKVDAVSGAVQGAVDDAAEALERADIAYANASYWEAECVVSSAEVLIGVNELLIGLCQNVPTGKVRKVTDIHFAFNSNPGGATIQTKKWNAAGTSSSVIHTATISAGTIRIGYNNLDVSVVDKERIFWDVTALGGTVPPTVLQCLVFGVIL